MELSLLVFQLQNSEKQVSLLLFTERQMERRLEKKKGSNSFELFQTSRIPLLFL